MLHPTVLDHLLGLAGVAPKRKSMAYVTLAGCDEGAILRAVTWYAAEVARGVLSSARLVEGLRALCAGWGDFYTIAHVERGSPHANAQSRRPDLAMVVRPGRGGSRWSTRAEHRVGAVRAHILTATDALDERLRQTHPAYARACRLWERPPAVDVIELHSVLADAWEEAGFEDRAAMHRRAAGGPPPTAGDVTTRRRRKRRGMVR